MSTPNVTRWIGVGLLGLPIYGVLTFFSSIDPQPDPNTHYEAWSRFVTTDFYVLKHLFLTVLGMIFGIFGSIALGAYLTRSRAGRMGLWAMVITVLGYALFLTWGGVSTFAAPREGQAYLAGIEGYKDLPIILALTMQGLTVVASILLGFVGNVLLGVAVWRSGILPKWAGALWAAAPVLMYVFGMVYAMTIGAQATPPTVPAGAVLLAIGGGWMALSVLRGPSPPRWAWGANRGCNNQPLRIAMRLHLRTAIRPWRSDFAEPPKGEVRRIPLLRGWVNKGVALAPKPRITLAYYLIPTTMKSGPTRCST